MIILLFVKQLTAMLLLDSDNVITSDNVLILLDIIIYKIMNRSILDKINKSLIKMVKTMGPIMESWATSAILSKKLLGILFILILGC